MAGSGRRRYRQRGGKRKRAEPAFCSCDECEVTKQPTSDAAQQGDRLASLPPELVEDIHRRLGFVDRLNLAILHGGHLLDAEAPCLVLPAEAAEEVGLFSVVDREASLVPAADPAMRDHVVLCSAGGWIVTADLRGAMRMVNPGSGEQADLPDITRGTIPFVRRFDLDLPAFERIRFGGQTPPADYKIPRGVWYGSTPWHMRRWFYRKVVLSASPRPHSYAAMLILNERFGAPAFATADDPAWRLAPSRDGIEDAVHHDGRFYSVTYSGVVEAWERDAETREYTSTAVAPSLPGGGGERKKIGEYTGTHSRKYIAAAPDGRLIVVLKEWKESDAAERFWSRDKVVPSFKVLVLDEPRRQWVETQDIGNAALFVGINNSMCVSTSGSSARGIAAGCIYYTDDELCYAPYRLEIGRRKSPLYRSSPDDDSYGYELLDLGVCNLKDGTVERLQGLPEHKCSPLPAWFTPSCN